MNRKAQLMTMDLLLALIPLTLVLGMSASAMAGISAQTQDYVSSYSVHRRANDFMDLVVKNPGNPPTWDTTLNTTVNGAANYVSGRPVSNYINARKIYNLNTTEIERALGTTNYNLSLYIEDPETFSEFVNFTFPSHGSPVPNTTKEIVAVERLVVVDNLLQISEDAPEGFADVSNVGGGKRTNCFDTEMTLTQDEINHFQFWLWLYFDCPAAGGGGGGPKCPTSMDITFNDEDTGPVSKHTPCEYPPDCNQVFKSSDLPIGAPQWNIWPVNDGVTYISQDACVGPNVNVEYWVNQTGTSPTAYELFVKVPAAFLTPGTQQIFVEIAGVESLTTGVIATAPQEITRETLWAYFASVDKYKDKKSRLVLRVWR